MAFLIGGLASRPMGLPGLTVVVGDNRLLLLALGTALLGSLIPYSLELVALRRLPAGTFGILLSLEPVFATLFGWLLLNQALGTWQLVAIALVISASIGVTVSPPARSSRADAPRRPAAKAMAPSTSTCTARKPSTRKPSRSATATVSSEPSSLARN